MIRLAIRSKFLVDDHRLDMFIASFVVSLAVILCILHTDQFECCPATALRPPVPLERCIIIRSKSNFFFVFLDVMLCFFSLVQLLQITNVLLKSVSNYMHNDFPHETMAFADKREFITDEDGDEFSVQKQKNSQIKDRIGMQHLRNSLRLFTVCVSRIL